MFKYYDSKFTCWPLILSVDMISLYLIKLVNNRLIRIHWVLIRVVSNSVQVFLILSPSWRLDSLSLRVRGEELSRWRYQVLIFFIIEVLYIEEVFDTLGQIEQFFITLYSNALSLQLVYITSESVLPFLHLLLLSLRVKANYVF